ncbi:MAG TPA: hypothetical protein VL096_12060, partial [Pirellulaceae bacterium]|nr:hypothetical protein [Pirellulaceae bacterium]
ATAGELAADLQRFLLAQPILARPVSWWERAWKWMVRNPWQATALGGLAVSLGGAILGVISLQSANQRTHIANLNLQQANRDLLKAKSESDVSFALTQESLARIVDRLRDDLYNVPQAEAVMLSTARDAAVLHRKLHRIRPEDRSVQRQLYQALRTLWLMEANHGNTDHSQQALQELQLVTNQMHARAPDDVGSTAQRIGLTADQADLLVAQGKPAEATKLREQVAVEVEQLERKYPTDPDALKLAAEEAGRRFNLAAAAGDLPGAIAATQARVEFTRRQLQNAPASATDSAKLALAQYLCGLGDILAVTRDTSAARKAFEQAEEIRGRLSQSLTEPRSMSAIDARVNKGLALVALLEQDLPLARAKLDVAEQQLRRSLDDYPEDRRYYHKSLADILLDHARLDVILEQPTAARSRVEQASKLVTEVLEGAPGDQLALGLNERVKQTEKAIAALAKPTSEAK